jgi:hypothetical protein
VATHSRHLRSQITDESKANPRERPTAGDVILAREPVKSSPWYTVREFPGTAQILCASREGALKLAKPYAHRHRVGIWDDQAGIFTRIDPRG